MAQWEAFLKNRPYSSRRKQRPSRSSLPPVPQTSPSSASSSSEAGLPAPPPLGLSPLLLRGLTARGGGGGGFPREAPPPSSFSEGGVGEIAVSALASGGARDSAASSFTGEGVAGSLLSQESLVIADSVPVASSSSPTRGRRSQSRGRGDSTRDRSRSSRLSPPRGQDSREEHRSVRSRSRGDCGLLCGSCSHSKDRSLSRGGRRSRRDSSRSPPARVWSCRSRSRSLDRYWD